MLILLLVILLVNLSMLAAFRGTSARHGYGNVQMRVSFRSLRPLRLRMAPLHDSSSKEIGDMTVVELKSVLKDLNLPVSGLKAQLQDRIQQARSVPGPGSSAGGPDTTDTSRASKSSGKSRIKIESDGEVYELESLLEEDNQSSFSERRKVTLQKIERASVSVQKGSSSSNGNSDSSVKSEQGDLWFDDSVFDEAEQASKGKGRRASFQKKASNSPQNQFSSSSSSSSLFREQFPSVSVPVSPHLERGQEVEATVTSFGPLGASVILHEKGEAPREAPVPESGPKGFKGTDSDANTNAMGSREEIEGQEIREEEGQEEQEGQEQEERDDWDNQWSSGSISSRTHTISGGTRGNSNSRMDPELAQEIEAGSVGRGLVLQQEITFWTAVHGGEPRIGQTITAYVQNVRGDGKVDVALRPVGFDKVLFARKRILEELRKAASEPDGDGQGQGKGWPEPGQGQGKGNPLRVGPKSSAADIWAGTFMAISIYRSYLL